MDLLLRKNSIDFLSSRVFCICRFFGFLAGKKIRTFLLFLVFRYTQKSALSTIERERGRETENKRVLSKRRRFVCLCVVRSIICVVLKGLLSHKLDLLRGKLQSRAEKKSDFANKTTCAKMMITSAVASSST